MSKLDDTEFKGVSQAVVDFKDDVRDMLNNGKYQSSVATTGIPGWVANIGESAFYSSGSDRRLYLKATSSNTSKGWQLVAGIDSSKSTWSANLQNVSRLFNTTYQNTSVMTRHIRLELVGIQADILAVDILVDSVNPPVVGVTVATRSLATLGTSHRQTHYDDIPPNWYYSVNTTSAIVGQWYERDE